MGGKNFRDPKNGNSFSEIFRLRLMLCLWDETKVHCGAYMQHILIPDKKEAEKGIVFNFLLLKTRITTNVYPHGISIFPPLSTN